MSTTSAHHLATWGHRCATGSLRRVRRTPASLPSGTALRLGSAHTSRSPAGQLQPSLTPLTFDPCLADAPRACAVDHRDHHHRIRDQGRRRGRLWLDPHRLRALLAAAVCMTDAGSARGSSTRELPPTHGADPAGHLTTGWSLAERRPWAARRHAVRRRSGATSSARVARRPHTGTQP